MTFPSLFEQFRLGLERTRHALWGRAATLFQGRPLDPDLLEELEELLISADLGVPTVRTLLDRLPRSGDPQHALHALMSTLVEILSVPYIPPIPTRPKGVLIIGVNGSGKTTTAAKLAHRWIGQGEGVLLVAADTFRAAAIDQLKRWGDRVGAPVIAHQMGGDPAAVTFDGVQAARARGASTVIVDTAGRLHTKRNLMEELKKIHRVLAREAGGEPEVILVLDGTMGLNALAQARTFHAALPLTGLVVTKLDGTAKGGAVIGIVHELQCPIRYLGMGEGLDDLLPFSAPDFVAALLYRPDETPRPNSSQIPS